MSKYTVKLVAKIASLIAIGLLVVASPAFAHHAMEGRLPTNFWEGFMSGLAHPVIGIDHLAFVIAIGLVSAGQKNGLLILAAFVLAAMVGTEIHVFGFDLPAAEVTIAGSVIAFGTLLILSKKPSWLVLAGLGAIAGLFHGYAYGESIVGAEMTPLVAYLVGFSLIQYGISAIALLLGNILSQKFARQFSSILRLIGLAICSIGIVFLSRTVLG